MIKIFRILDSNKLRLDRWLFLCFCTGIYAHNTLGNVLYRHICTANGKVMYRRAQAHTYDNFVFDERAHASRVCHIEPCHRSALQVCGRPFDVTTDVAERTQCSSPIGRQPEPIRRVGVHCSSSLGMHRRACLSASQAVVQAGPSLYQGRITCGENALYALRTVGIYQYMNQYSVQRRICASINYWIGSRHGWELR